MPKESQVTGTILLTEEIDLTHKRNRYAGEVPGQDPMVRQIDPFLR